MILGWSLSARRAWIEIVLLLAAHPPGCESLSARRAWIEIPAASTAAGCTASLSARRAWIEIEAGRSYIGANSVALRKESVDRNKSLDAAVAGAQGRSPQGERG